MGIKIKNAQSLKLKSAAEKNLAQGKAGLKRPVGSKDNKKKTLNFSVEKPILIQNKQRKNALDIKKEVEAVEQEQLAKERKWDIPAFLRRRT